MIVEIIGFKRKDYWQEHMRVSYQHKLEKRSVKFLQKQGIPKMVRKDEHSEWVIVWPKFNSTVEYFCSKDACHKSLRSFVSTSPWNRINEGDGFQTKDHWQKHMEEIHGITLDCQKVEKQGIPRMARKDENSDWVPIWPKYNSNIVYFCPVSSCLDSLKQFVSEVPRWEWSRINEGFGYGFREKTHWQWHMNSMHFSYRTGLDTLEQEIPKMVRNDENSEWTPFCHSGPNTTGTDEPERRSEAESSTLSIDSINSPNGCYMPLV